jgi:tetratricopeptide (TPR) repeat protein
MWSPCVKLVLAAVVSITATASFAATDKLHAEVARRTARTGEQPDDIAAWVGLGDVLMQQSRDHANHDLCSRAEVAYRKAWQLDPRHVPALVGLAWVANTRHEFDDGRRWAREALAIDARVPEAHALLGDAAVEAGDYDEAMDHYQATLDLRPDLSSYSRAGHLLWLMGDARRAQILMRKAIAAGGPHAENTAWCRAELGLMLFHEGALLPAEQELETALTEAPRNPHVLATAARVKIARKEYSAALVLYQQAMDLAPTVPVMAALADLHTLTGNREKAENLTTHILESVSSEEHSHSHGAGGSHTHAHAHSGDAQLARFLADSGRDPDRAVAEAETAYESFKNVGVTDTLAWCYYNKGRMTDAARLVRRALRWGTPDAMLYFHAGMIYAGMGDAVTARKYLYQALSLNPWFHPKYSEVAARTIEELGATLAKSSPSQ